MGAWTDAGFTAKIFEWYKEQIRNVFIDAYGPDFLLDDSLPQGVVIQELAELFYNADMDGVEALARMNLNTMTGVYLDMVGALRGVPRSLGSPSSVGVTITSNSSTIPYTIPAGTIFTASSGEEYKNTALISVESVTQTEQLVAVEDGEATTQVGDTMTVNISNITDVSVASVAQGTDTETDASYRTRLLRRYTVTTNTVQNIVNLVRALDCVETAGVNYNDSDETYDTMPAHTTEFMAVPKSGYDIASFESQVGQVILDNKTPSASLFGNTTVQLTDPFGKQKTVKFTTPTKISLQISVQVTTPESTGLLDLSNATAIKEKIKDYINSLDIGHDVSYSRCLAPLTADQGFDISSFKIKAVDDENWTVNSNYTIDSRQYANIEVANIYIGA